MTGSPGSWPEVTVRTASSGGSYGIVVAPGALEALPSLLAERAPAHRYALVADETVMALHGERTLSLIRGAGHRVDAFTFPAGEANKTRREWARLTDALLEAGLGRDACVVAMGGGVTGDLAGFVAATYMRGIPVVQLPTSLLAMVDASVGGKTGVDVPLGKNLVGAFHPPRFVLADTDLVRTLPRAHRREGLAEAVKHGAILDADHLQQVRQRAGGLLDGDPDATAEVVRASVELKAAVVARDEREAGLREILNFGHTLGHALEAASGYVLSHGSAVALGMLLEARLGEALTVTAPGVAQTLEATAREVELPVRVPPGMELDRVVALLGQDKKARGGTPRFVLLEALGRVAELSPGEAGSRSPWSRPVPPDRVREVLRDAVGPAA